MRESKQEYSSNSESQQECENGKSVREYIQVNMFRKTIVSAIHDSPHGGRPSNDVPHVTCMG